MTTRVSARMAAVGTEIRPSKSSCVSRRDEPKPRCCTSPDRRCGHLREVGGSPMEKPQVRCVVRGGLEPPTFRFFRRSHNRRSEATSASAVRSMCDSGLDLDRPGKLCGGAVCSDVAQRLGDFLVSPLDGMDEPLGGGRRRLAGALHQIDGACAGGSSQALPGVPEGRGTRCPSRPSFEPARMPDRGRCRASACHPGRRRRSPVRRIPRRDCSKLQGPRMLSTVAPRPL